jgi:CheY-like chemotaxis protein
MSNPTILIVEDDAAALMLTRRVLNKAIPEAHIEVAVDGDEAINSVLKAAEENRLPLVMLLDWNLPKRHGREVLQTIRQDPRSKDLPVVIVTSSNAEPDKSEAFSLGANNFVHKSLELSEFRDNLTATCKQDLNL